MSIRTTALATLIFGALLAGAAWGAAAKQSTDKDAPAAAKAPGNADGQAELPAGHPPIGGDSAALPKGHPPLPAGHPPLSDAMGAEQGPVKGTLMIKVTQGTPNGPSLAGDLVVVELFHKNKSIKKLETKLDDQGMAVLELAQIDKMVQPMVTMQHAGATFGVVGRPLSPQHPDQAIRLTVFELTDDKPDWHIAMRHVMVGYTPHGLRVNEVLAVYNPGELAWRGEVDSTSTAAKTPGLAPRHVRPACRGHRRRSGRIPAPRLWRRWTVRTVPGWRP